MSITPRKEGIQKPTLRSRSLFGVVIALLVAGVLSIVGALALGIGTANAGPVPSGVSSGSTSTSSTTSSSSTSTTPPVNPSGSFSAATVCVKSGPALIRATFSGSGFDPAGSYLLQVAGRSQNAAPVTVNPDGSASASLDIPYAGTPASSLSLEVVVASSGDVVVGPTSTKVTVTDCGPPSGKKTLHVSAGFVGGNCPSGTGDVTFTADQSKVSVTESVNGKAIKAAKTFNVPANARWSVTFTVKDTKHYQLQNGKATLTVSGKNSFDTGSCSKPTQPTPPPPTNTYPVQSPTSGHGPTPWYHNPLIDGLLALVAAGMALGTAYRKQIGAAFAARARSH